jgi:hypothetical protein
LTQRLYRQLYRLPIFPLLVPIVLPILKPVSLTPSNTLSTQIINAPTQTELREARTEMASVYSTVASAETRPTTRQSERFFEDSFYEPLELYEQPMIMADARNLPRTNKQLKISIDPNKYATANNSLGDDLNQYTSDQFENISSGKGLESPPLEKVTWKNISKGIATLFAQEND